MNNEEKKKLVDEACDLFNEAAEKITKAKKLLKKCGMECCINFDETIPADKYTNCGSNLLFSKGIEKFEKITGEKGYFNKDIYDGRRYDRSRKYIKYKNLIFLQLGAELHKTDKEFTFE